MIIGTQLVQVGNVYFDDGTYRFNDFKDYLIAPKTKFVNKDFTIDITKLNMSKNWYEIYPFMAKHITVRLVFNNPNSNRKLILHNIGINAKQVL